MEPSLRYVFDTNTLVSAACFPRSFGRRAFDYVLDHAAFLTCSGAIDELIDVIGRPKFDRFTPQSPRIDFLDIYVPEAELITIPRTLKICRDATDDKFLERAATGKADFLITRDNDLLVLNPYQGVQICDDERLLQLLAAP